MLRDITLGQYFSGNSILHKLDPRAKIILVLLYVVMIFIAGNDNVVNSNVSSDSLTLNLVDITSETQIEINANNQLVITPENHNEEYGIWLNFKIDGSNYEFKVNNNNLILKQAHYIQSMA